MAIIEGTGIKTAGTEARKKAVQVSKQSKTAGGKGTLQFYKENFMNQIDAGGGVENASEADQKRYRQYEKDLQKPKQNIFSEIFKFSKTPEKQNFFSPGGGAFDKRNNIKIASSDLSNLEASGFTDDEEGSDASTFGKSFTKQASANLADSSIYKKKEDNIYRDTTDVYSDFKNIYKRPATEEDTVKSIEKFYGLDPRGIKYTPRDESKYGATPTEGAFPGQEDKVITTKEKITGVRDFGYMKGDKLYGTYKKDQGGLGIGAALDQNRYGLVARPGGLGGMFSDDKVTQTYVKAMGQNVSDSLATEERLRKEQQEKEERERRERGSEEWQKSYKNFLNDKTNQKTTETESLAELDERFKNVKGVRETEGTPTLGTMPSMGISQAGRELAAQNRLGKAADEKKEPSTLQKVGNFIGGITNAALGIQPARGGELTNELTGVDKALSGATKKFHLGSSGHSVDDVYMPSMAEAYKRPKTGIEKGFEQLGNFIGKITRPPGAEGAEMPSTPKNETGDTSFSAYVRGGGEGQERGKATEWQSRTEFLKKNPNTSMETYLSSLPYGATDFMKPDPNFPGARILDTDAYERYFMTGKTTGASGEKRTTPQPTDTSKKTVAGLPSNYKATEAEAFRKAAAFKEAQGIAKRNPNVSVGVDSKGQPKATATNDSGRARAQAAAVNRKLAGKSISQVRAANNQAMRDRAEARHKEFKKTRKSTVSARRDAAKRRVQAAAKKRHTAFKKKRAAKAAAKKAKAKAKAAAKARNKRNRTRNRRSRSRSKK